MVCLYVQYQFESESDVANLMLTLDFCRRAGEDVALAIVFTVDKFLLLSSNSLQRI